MTWLLIVITTAGHIYSIAMDGRVECTTRMDEGIAQVEEQTGETVKVAACGRNVDV